MYATATTARSRFMTDGVGSTPPERLLVLLYERLLRDLDEAATAIGAGTVEGAHEALSHAQDIIAELHAALDPGSWELADRMGDLYTWLAETLAQANMKKDAALVAEARSVVQPLCDTWSEAARTAGAGTTVAPGGIAPPTSIAAGGLDVAG